MNEREKEICKALELEGMCIAHTPETCNGITAVICTVGLKRLQDVPMQGNAFSRLYNAGITKIELTKIEDFQIHLKITVKH